MAGRAFHLNGNVIISPSPYNQLLKRNYRICYNLGSQLAIRVNIMSHPTNKWHVLSAVLLAPIMGPIDASVVNITFPHLTAVFGVGRRMVGWVSMSYCW